MPNLFQALFGSRRDRWLKKSRPLVARINALEPEFQALDEDALRARTQVFRARLAKGETLDQLLPEAFAAVREAARRVLGLRAFDVQLLGALALHQGKIAEMRTGEGKTLVATLPAYLNALTGQGVHVVTVNDYLAQRDAATMAPVFAALGLTTGVVHHRQEPGTKAPAYACDITYGTNNEFGFDYLRDNLATELAGRHQRSLAYAIVDEVDSILIDEARTPLIISGPDPGNTGLYQTIDALSVQLKPQATEDGPGDFFLDAKTRAITLSEAGQARADELFEQAGLLPDDLYGARHLSLLHHLNAALRARHAYLRDKDYILRDGKVVIVDEFTGRALAGRRWGEGLHQAVEAKEGVKVEPEDQVLATVTLQNFFRSYAKLAGMTGTADTEAYELQEIYGLEVLVIPTHRPMVRRDNDDLVFLTRDGKFRAVVREIADCVARQQPVLVGTTSIEVSEQLSAQLTAVGIAHEVLNAKQHEREAQIIADAGRPGAVTLATNMAGRGTDIVLGGHRPIEIDEALQSVWSAAHEQAKAAGGLHVIGTERHESRRIDNQLRGRSGRQGDPGSSRFFLSIEDHLLKVFMPAWSHDALVRMGMSEDQPIAARVISRQVEAAQRKIEGFYFDQRKSLLDYDNVANQQRKTIYAHRTHLLETLEPQAEVHALIPAWTEELASSHLLSHPVDADQHLDALLAIAAKHGATLEAPPLAVFAADHDGAGLATAIAHQLQAALDERAAQWGPTTTETVFRAALLVSLDTAWQDQLVAMELLRSGIHLRAMAQKQPKEEYKREAFALFSQLSASLPERALALILRHVPEPEAVPVVPAPPVVALPAGMRMSALKEVDPTQIPPRRNAPCPCGSGRRYKECHGKGVGLVPSTPMGIRS